MTGRLESFSLSEQGAVRLINQDAVCTIEEDVVCVYVVADGMGGHLDGEIASRAVVSAVEEWTQTTQTADFDPYESLRVSLKRQNKIIYDRYSSGPEICGSTMVLLWLEQDRFTALTVGDSRIYRLQNRKAVRISVDDVWENDPLLTMGLTPEQIRRHPDFGKLSNAFGTHPELTMHELTGMTGKDDVFLLCSDGIYKYCKEKDLDRAMRTAKKHGPKRALSLLSRTVEKNGAGDNYSAVMIRCL